MPPQSPLVLHGGRPSASEPPFPLLQLLLMPGCRDPVVDDGGLQLASLPDRHGVFWVRRSEGQARGWGALSGQADSLTPSPPTFSMGPELGPHLRSRWCAPPWMVTARTDALRLLRICQPRTCRVGRTPGRPALQPSPTSQLRGTARAAARDRVSWLVPSQRTGKPEASSHQSGEPEGERTGQ